MQNGNSNVAALDAGRLRRIASDGFDAFDTFDKFDTFDRSRAAPAAAARLARRGTALLDASAVHIRYENPKTGEITDAVRGVDLAIQPGEFVSIVGLSGCGKSSFLSAVAGLTPIASGSIAIEGRRVTRPGPDCSVVFQRATLLPWRTVLDNITYGLELRGVRRKAARERARRVLELVQLKGFERHHPSALSGGMQQRVNLARALVTEPRLLLLDEPFAALDAITREAMQAELLSIWDTTRNAVLMVTHQIDEAVLLSDRVIVFSDRPARVAAEIHVDLPRPRGPEVRYTPRFDALAQRIRALIDGSAALAREARHGS